MGLDTPDQQEWKITTSCNKSWAVCENKTVPPEEKINQSEWGRLYYFDCNSHSMCLSSLNISPSYILCPTLSFISFIGQESKWLLYQYISYIKAICQLNYSNTFSQYEISQRSNSIVTLQKLYKCPMWLEERNIPNDNRW